MIAKRTLFAAAIALIGVAFAPRAEAQHYAPTRFSVEVTGEGPDVILIPGLASSRDVWDATIAQLSATHRVHAVQLAGFAGEPAGPAAEGAVIAPFVEDLNAYIEANRLDHPAVIGHSLGGVSALMLARDHAGNVGRVMVVDALPFFAVLIDPAATVESITPRAVQARDALLAMSDEQFAGLQAATMARMVRTEAARPEVIGWSLASDRSVVARATFEGMTTDLRADLAAIQAPVTIVYAADPAMGPEAAVTGLYTALYAALPNHALVRVDQSYHFVPLDQPEAFAAVVADFLH